MNKLRAFLLRRFVRDTVGARASSFDMGAVLDGGLCLVRVPKGVLGEETTRLLGSFVLARALADRHPPGPHRASRPQGRRPVHRRMPELPYPAARAGRHARRSPRLPDLPGARAPEHGTAQPANYARPSPRTRAARSSSPSPLKTPATCNAMSLPTCPPTTWLTWTPTRPLPAWSSREPRRPRSPCAPGPCRPRFPDVPTRIRAAARAASGARLGNSRKTRAPRAADPRQRPGRADPRRTSS